MRDAIHLCFQVFGLRRFQRLRLALQKQLAHPESKPHTGHNSVLPRIHLLKTATHYPSLVSTPVPSIENWRSRRQGTRDRFLQKHLEQFDSARLPLTFQMMPEQTKPELAQRQYRAQAQ